MSTKEKKGFRTNRKLHCQLASAVCALVFVCSMVVMTVLLLRPGDDVLGDNLPDGWTTPPWPIAFVQVSGGDGHTLGITHTGELWAWGYNSSGQLGDNTTTNRLVPTRIDNLPSSEMTPYSVVGIAAGSAYSLAITDDGALWAWGNNMDGQLGDNTTTNRHIPIRIDSLPSNGMMPGSIIGVYAGGHHSLALTDDGALWAWGANAFGRLGDGTTTQRNVPTRIDDLPSNGMMPYSVVSIAAGHHHSLALTDDGALWAWGNNGQGRLGDNTTTHRYVPTRIDDSISNAMIPGSVIGISAGTQHSLALTDDGGLGAWGGNTSGQLGDNTTTNRHVPTRIDSLPSNTMTQGSVVGISAGSNHSLAITGTGQLWAWGSNGSGRLGDNTTTYRHVPTRIDSLPSNAIVPGSVVGVSGGNIHSAAITRYGELFTWGNNARGELGDGTTTTRLAPVRIGVGAEWASVSSRGMHTMHGLTTNGELFAWGYNGNGNLGDGTLVDSLIPILIARPEPPTAIVIDGGLRTVTVDDAPVQLTYTLTGGENFPYTLIWTSSDTSVATVDSNGLVTIVDEGYTTIRVTVSGHPTVTYPITFVVQAAGHTVGFITQNLPNGKVGEAYTYTILAYGSEPLTFAVASGSLPGGLSLNSATGVISGTPTHYGTFTFELSVSDATLFSATQEFTITVAPGEEPPPAQQLPTPPPPTKPEIELDDTTITWVVNPNAVAYAVYVGGQRRQVVSTGDSFDLATLNLAAGSHRIQIRALGDGTEWLDSELSDYITFVVEPQEPPTPGPQPQPDDDEDFDWLLVAIIAAAVAGVAILALTIVALRRRGSDKKDSVQN